MYFFSGAFCAADLEAQQCWDLLDENVTTQYILEVLAKKAYSYETFAQMFPGYGFHMPWFTIGFDGTTPVPVLCFQL